MDFSRIDVQRRRVGQTMLALAALPAVWALTPAWWRPGPPSAAAETVAAGRDLFAHEWQPHDPLAHGDGLGPVFNATSCAACHFQGGLGGGGGAKANVVTFTARSSDTGQQLLAGLLHKSAVEPTFLETGDWLKQTYPTVVKSVRNTCNCPPFIDVTVDPVAVGSINSPALFGAGWIDRLSGKEIVQANAVASVKQVGREFNGDFSGIVPGRPRFLGGGRIGKFGWKAQFATLEEFVAAACANELGLGTPGCPQAQPLRRPDFAKSAPDLDRKQFAALAAFVDTLPRPVEIEPADSHGMATVARGREVFQGVGCAVCHPAKIAGLDGVYSDFLLHKIEDEKRGGGANGYGDPLPPDPNVVGPEPNEWKTPPLWGVADSAPYFHDGGSPTLDSAIRRHGAAAKPVTEQYAKLTESDRAALLAFLGTLRAPNAEPRPAPAQGPQGLAAR